MNVVKPNTVMKWGKMNEMKSHEWNQEEKENNLRERIKAVEIVDKHRKLWVDAVREGFVEGGRQVLSSGWSSGNQFDPQIQIVDDACWGRTRSSLQDKMTLTFNL